MCAGNMGVEESSSGRRTIAVIPCFNEEATIGSVVLKARRYVDEVLVVDDGIAAGYTMLAATRFLRKRGAEKIFIGVPTCSHRGATAVSKEADEVYCLNCRSGFFFAVADAYKKWRDLEMKEVLKILHVNRDILLFKPFSTR